MLDAQRTDEAMGGPEGSPSGFRIPCPQKWSVLQTLLRLQLHAMAKQTSGTELRGRLAIFRAVVLTDGCAFKLARALSGLCSGTGQYAEPKLHAVYSGRAAGAIAVETTAGSVHASEGFWPTRWQREALYIWDLWFNSDERFIDTAQFEVTAN